MSDPILTIDLSPWLLETMAREGKTLRVSIDGLEVVDADPEPTGRE